MVRRLIVTENMSFDGVVSPMDGWFDPAAGINELGGERLHPPIDGDVINSDAAFGEQLFDIAVGRAVAQVSAHLDRDRLGRETVASRCG